MLGYKIIKENEYYLIKAKCDAFEDMRNNIIESEEKLKTFTDRMFELNKMLDNKEITYEQYKKLWRENKRQ